MRKFIYILPISLLYILNSCITLGETDGLDNTQLPNTELPLAANDIGLGAEQTRGIDRMTMVYVPEGQFTMGNDGSDTCPFASPAHTVALDSFWIDQVEITNEMFAQFLNDQGNQSQNDIMWFEPGEGHRGISYGYIEENDGRFITREGYERYPVIEVSWYGAAAYCSWIGGRLPTEAEWEYAARGPEGNMFPWGNSFNGNLVNYCDMSCQEPWHDNNYEDAASQWIVTGSYPEGASWCNAMDMAGNVWEWVNDWWSEDYYSISPPDNPEGPVNGTFHIARGGSWYDEWWRMDLTCRKGLQSSSARMHWVGFRCVIPMK